MPCQNTPTPLMIMAFSTSAMNTTPRMPPTIRPSPPLRLAPPRTVAVMTLSSMPMPALTTALLSRAASSTPASPASKPMMTKAMSVSRPTRMPESFAARGLPPMK